jgi:hypothetical protein
MTAVKVHLRIGSGTGTGGKLISEANETYETGSQQPFSKVTDDELGSQSMHAALAHREDWSPRPLR